MDAFRVISPGSFTTVQDRGRYSFIDRGAPRQEPLTSSHTMLPTSWWAIPPAVPFLKSP